MNYKYKRLNNIIGWAIFSIAIVVYTFTMERTASWWDCGEFIACGYKLQIGHPPGAPLFMMLSRIMSLLSFGNVKIVALTINFLSALASAFTVLFLFWTITALAKKLLSNDNYLTSTKHLLIFGSGIIGAMAFAFSDSFWFSAVEAEVYAMSSFFTAIVFWAMLKWDASNDSHSNKWLILIAYLIGLSIGVHLLNLLTIPALTFIYYFKKHKTNLKGIFVTIVIALVILSIVQYGIIPGIVKLASYFELVFVNYYSMQFGSGIIAYIIILTVIFAILLKLTTLKRNVFLNTSVWALFFILLGYTTYSMVVIRSLADPPINENAPDDVFSLMSYLNRDQYGDNPVLYGQYYDAEVIRSEEGSPEYIKGETKYEKIGNKTKYIYDSTRTTFFPRMYSSSPSHIEAYKKWGDIKDGEKPSFLNNIKFFFTYQLGHMYLRYFMWNYCGRQNDIQGNGEAIYGNWLSGIEFVDKFRLGSQKNMPENLSNNKARNTFYFLPLFLGLLGMLHHFKNAKKDALVVSILFFMTGIAIVLFLNQTPYQPRERDYSYVGSFYAFAIWIGLGVVSVFDIIPKKTKNNKGAIFTIIITFITVPFLMAYQGWNDHNRSSKTTARDFAMNYLNSCAPNAILFTNGDNDTFPLWYAQEVEGIRTDVRVVNYTLAGGAWYIEQLFRKVYNSEALPLTIKKKDYKDGTNDYVPYYELDSNKAMNLSDLIKFIASNTPDSKLPLENGERISFLPTKNVFITVDSNAIKTDTSLSKSIKRNLISQIQWTINKNYLFKNELMLLDLIATNNWKRPIYFASPSSVRRILNIEKYCFLEGYVYRFIPVEVDSMNFIKGLGNVNREKCYKIMMKEFLNGSLDNVTVPSFYDCQSNIRTSRNNFARVAQAYLFENDKETAIELLNHCEILFPNTTQPFDMNMIPFAQLYYSAKSPDKANQVLQNILNYYSNNIKYYCSLNKKWANVLEPDKILSLRVINNIANIAHRYHQESIENQAISILNLYSGK